MNLRQPPPLPSEAILGEVRERFPELYEYLCNMADYLEETWNFLQNPVFETIRFYPRPSAPATEEGRVYYDSDDDKLKCRDAAAWQDTY